MMALRLWSVRHAVALKRPYDLSFLLLPPMRWRMRLVGRRRVDHVLREELLAEAIVESGGTQPVAPRLRNCTPVETV
jgi:hypothetical protein